MFNAYSLQWGYKSCVECWPPRPRRCRDGLEHRRLDAIRDGHTTPPIASRSLVILHVSPYDAVNGIARTYESYLVQIGVPASASREAAASAAPHRALERFALSP